MHLHLDTLAAERRAEITDDVRRAAFHRAVTHSTTHTAPVRRIAARALLAISLTSAAAVRRLDRCLAEDRLPRATPHGA